MTSRRSRRRLSVTPANLKCEALARGRPVLFAAREQRIKPARDDKALAEWNGMMLRAFAYAAGALGRDDYRRVAEANAEFILRELRTTDGPAAVPLLGARLADRQ